MILDDDSSKILSVQLFYFSGTGNTARLAKITKDYFESLHANVTLTFVPSANQLSEAMTQTIGKAILQADLIGILSPIYALDMPRLVRKFLKRFPPARSSQKAFVIMNGGAWDEAGWAVVHAVSLLRRKGYNTPLADVVMMPNNWIPLMSSPHGEVADKIRKTGEDYLLQKLIDLMNGQVWHKPFSAEPYGWFRLRLIHFFFWNIEIRYLWRSFKVTEACTGCGLCVKRCPANSLVLKDNRPKWRCSCEHCVRCMNLCPSRAITQFESLGHMSRRPTYVEPHFLKYLNSEGQ